MSAASRGLVRTLRAYQRWLSPRKPAPTCRFTPSCSQYAVEAVERHGALRGGWLAAWRVLRCNPLVPGGPDPVPEQFPARHRSPSETTPGKTRPGKTRPRKTRPRKTTP